MRSLLPSLSSSSLRKLCGLVQLFCSEFIIHDYSDHWRWKSEMNGYFSISWLSTTCLAWMTCYFLFLMLRNIHSLPRKNGNYKLFARQSDELKKQNNTKFEIQSVQLYWIWCFNFVFYFLQGESKPSVSLLDIYKSWLKWAFFIK